ncbi:MAG TPA: SLBB domain-containing protein, partial [Acidimicrobiales bacterium]|nr:SLBB domain-containing protein [Acidimicrobiales bacterium]
ALRNRQERIRDLVARAGGLSDQAYVGGSAFVRHSAAVGRIGIDLARAMRDPASRDNFVLEPGDSLFIPRYEPTVKVEGAVNAAPIAVSFVTGRNLLYYVDAAGGTTRTADLDRAFVRQPNGEVEPLNRRWWIIPDAVPKPRPGSTIVVPGKEPGKVDWASVAGSVAQVLASAIAIIVVVSRTGN